MRELRAALKAWETVAQRSENRQTVRAGMALLLLRASFDFSFVVALPSACSVFAVLGSPW